MDGAAGGVSRPDLGQLHAAELPIPADQRRIMAAYPVSSVVPGGIWAEADPQGSAFRGVCLPGLPAGGIFPGLGPDAGSAGGAVGPAERLRGRDHPDFLPGPRVQADGCVDRFRRDTDRNISAPSWAYSLEKDTEN